MKMYEYMKLIHIQSCKTPIGELLLGSFDGQLCLLDFQNRKARNSIDKRIQRGAGARYVKQDDALLQRTRAQLDEYFDGKRKDFDLPVLLIGTDFQKQVWRALREVSYGATPSYLQLARRIGKEKAVRAVASACGVNALSLVLPCHRIIGSNGELTGYAGGLAAKKYLLALEKAHGK